MPRDEQNLIPTDAPQSDFGNFLSQEGNKRIFFSGKFGIGKTYFLQRFFETHKDEYDVYHLYPIRYQISSNENILELLKYDILVEFFKNHPKAFNRSEKRTINLWMTLARDRGLKVGKEVLADVIGSFTILGRSMKDWYVAYKKIHEGFERCKDKPDDAVEEFIVNVTEKEQIATDYISLFLRKNIKRLKHKKKSILILDDFDRIDPEHIFRILNILSIHMESDEENTFGFDRIIIVADIKNIKNIFHHKYGKNTNFDGYFDKFFTLRIFEFDNDKEVISRIPSLLKQIRFENEWSKNKILDDAGYTRIMLEGIFREASSAGLLNLRQLYRPLKYPFSELNLPEPSRYMPTTSLDARRDVISQCIDVGIKLLIAIYGSKENLIDIVHKIKEEWSDDNILFWRDGHNDYIDLASRMVQKLNKGSHTHTHNFSWLGQYQVNFDSDVRDIKCPFTFNLRSNQKPADAFYDTLIEYIKRGGYLKFQRSIEEI